MTPIYCYRLTNSDYRYSSHVGITSIISLLHVIYIYVFSKRFDLNTNVWTTTISMGNVRIKVFLDSEEYTQYIGITMLCMF